RRHAIRLLESFGTPHKESPHPNPLPAVPGRGDKTLDASTLERLSKLVDDPDTQVRLQLAYSLGEFAHPIVGQLLGRLARQSQGDAYVLSAVMSSLRRDNLADVLSEVVKDGAAPKELLEQLLGQATAFRHETALVALLSKATEPLEKGGYALWQFSAVDQF